MLKKKGFVFTIDAGLAFFLTLLILLSTNFFIARTEEQFWTKYHVVKQGQDIIATLDYNGTLQTLSPGEIEGVLETMTGTDTEMYIYIDCDDPPPFDVGTLTTEKRFIFSDTYVFVKLSDSSFTTCNAKYSIWVK